MSKLRKLGDVLLDLEPLLDEMVQDHELQMCDVLHLIRGHLLAHNPDCVEKYVDGTDPVLFYGHQDIFNEKRSKSSK